MKKARSYSALPAVLFLFASHFSFAAKDTLAYVQRMLDVKLEDFSGKDGGVLVTETGPGCRITGNWPGPKKWVIGYAGEKNSKPFLLKHGSRTKNVNEFCREVIRLANQHSERIYMLLNRNGSIYKPFYAKIDDFNFASEPDIKQPEVKQEEQLVYRSENDLINATLNGYRPIRLRKGDSTCVAIIGRDMCRVRPYVEAFKYKFPYAHVETWEGYDKSLPENQNVQNNCDWIKGKVDSKCTIIDLGCDPAYYCADRKDTYDCSKTSPFYECEKKEAFGTTGLGTDVVPTSVNPTNITGTTVGPTDVSPTTVNPTTVKPTAMKKLNPFMDKLGVFHSTIHYFGIGMAVMNHYAIGKSFENFSGFNHDEIGIASGYFSLYTGFERSLNKTHTLFVGGEFQVNRTPKTAIATLGIGNVHTEIGITMLNVAVPVGIGVGSVGRIAFVFEPGTGIGILGGFMRVPPYTTTYDQAGKTGIGGHMAVGMNMKFLKSGFRLRVGQRFLKTKMVADQDLIMDWSGWYTTIGYDRYF
ncbi:MAG TPA: hypothetical protein VI112_07905 [Bacteroidia bacterium]|jgi:hypothetical protein